MQKRIIYFALFLVGILGCKKKTHDLPAPSDAVIETIRVNDNMYIFRNATSAGGSGTLWDFGGLLTSNKMKDTMFFVDAGTYTVSLISNSKGGISKTSTTITVEKSAEEYKADFTIEKIDPNRFRVVVITPNRKSNLFKYTIGLNDTSRIDTAYFPFIGNFDITLRVNNKIGSLNVFSILKKTVTVDENDASNPDLFNKVYIALTGGIADADGKTWVISPAANIQGTGAWKRTKLDFSYYAYPDGLATDPAWANGALSNEFTFNMRGYQFIPKNTNATANWFIGNKKLGMSNALYSDKAFVDPNIAPASFKLTKSVFPVDTTKLLGYSLDFNNKAYLGYYQNRIGYEICKISATNDSIWVRQKYNDNPDVYTASPDVFDDPTQDPSARTMLLVEKK